MMKSCSVVVINEALEKNDVTFAARPSVELKAIPFGSSRRQIVRQQSEVGLEAFTMFEVPTSHPADIAGMAFFLTISNTAGVVSEVKGKVSQEMKGFVSFKVAPFDVGFYSYSVSVRADGYSQVTLDGSYVVQA
jgi:hypothetical protein